MAIIDGDTIRVRLQGTSVERVRLLGIDAPEVQPGEKLDRDAARTAALTLDLLRRPTA